ncbi:MAG: WG repeat-containing protein [Bacteroidales bacterium]|nr:WG repeat-containing protein [Bacteroidales bacterium]
MKHLCLTVCLLLLSLIAFGQAKQIKAALSAGRKWGSFYEWTNPKEDMLEPQKLTDYAAKNGYIVSSILTKEIPRFGGIATTVKSFEVIPQDEYPVYIGELCGGKNSDWSRPQKASMCFIDLQAKELVSKKFDNVVWNGAVVQGKIDGKGVGVKVLDPCNLVIVNGTFSEGIPQGRVYVSTYKLPTPYASFAKRKGDTTMSEFGQKSEGITSYFSKGYHGYIDSEGNILVPPTYASASPYKSGFATVTLQNLSGVKLILNKQGKIDRVESSGKVYYSALFSLSKGDSEVEIALREFLKNQYQKDSDYLRELYKKAQTAAETKSILSEGRDAADNFITNFIENDYDPDQMKEIAQSVSDYFAIGRALELKPLSSYWNKYADPPVYYGDNEYDIASNGLKACERSAAQFKNLADYAKPLLTEKFNKVKHQLDSDYWDYCDEMNKRHKEELAKLETIHSYSQIQPLVESTSTYSHDNFTSYYFVFSDIGTLDVVWHKEAYGDWSYTASSNLKFNRDLSSLRAFGWKTPHEAFLIEAYKEAKTKVLEIIYVKHRKDEYWHNPNF